MENKKISVIIPIYNTADDLKKCLSSVSKQTYKNLEIICVDDGSSDGSEKIVDEFAMWDARFIVIHQRNQGESNARNSGLKMATGDYIAFVDCDDWIEQDMYQVLVDEMEANDVELVASGWYKERDGLAEDIKNQLQIEDSVICRDKFLKYLYMRDSYRALAYMWNKLYKREHLFDEEGKLILFDETLKLGGDVLWLARVALKVQNAKYIDKAFYHYNQRSVSGCHTNDVHKLRDWIRAYEMVVELLVKEGIDRVIIDYVKRFLAYHSSNAAQVAYEQEEYEALKIFQEFMKTYEEEYVVLNRQWPERICRYREILSY